MDDIDVVAIGSTGFRFYPTEEELVSFYLHNKLGLGSTTTSTPTPTPQIIDRVIPVLDIYQYNPSDLPRLGGEYSPADGEQWFFFIPRQERDGGRPNRLTKCGYWKATGSPGNVYSSQNRVIGRKKPMVFYVGRAPNGTKTPWKMIQYNAFSSSSPPHLMEEVCLCRVYKRSKSLRMGAFDRRPPPSVAEIIRDCSLESSSSGEFVEGGNNCWTESLTDGEIFRDLEPLSWSDLLSND